MNVEEECDSEDDYYGSYGSSYGSDYGLSSSVEKQYMFKRDQSVHTHNLSNFLDNLGEGEAESQSGSRGRHATLPGQETEEDGPARTWPGSTLSVLLTFSKSQRIFFGAGMPRSSLRCSRMSV